MNYIRFNINNQYGMEVIFSNRKNLGNTSTVRSGIASSL